jgi:urease accessory protein
MVVIQSLSHQHPARPGGRRVVEIPMSAEDRRRVRRRIEAPDGAVFALELPTGTVLHPGQVLHEQPDRLYVVGAAPEEVLLVRPRDWREAARVGHMIGNLHREIDVQDEGIIVLYDATLLERLRRAGIPAGRTHLPFRGNPPPEHKH